MVYVEIERVSCYNDTMSIANPYMPPETDNLALAIDMRLLAERLGQQADAFKRNSNGLACMVTAEREFNALARSLRVAANSIQPNVAEDQR